jgi:hypothetical protein
VGWQDIALGGIVQASPIGLAYRPISPLKSKEPLLRELSTKNPSVAFVGAFNVLIL